MPTRPFRNSPFSRVKMFFGFLGCHLLGRVSCHGLSYAAYLDVYHPIQTAKVGAPRGL